VTIARYILGVPIATVGVVILALHLFLFVRGVMLRKRVASALPLLNFFILIVGFALLPVPFGLALGFVLAFADLALWVSVNSFRP
jgi:hypothetical protein